MKSWSITEEIRELLEEKYDQYNRPGFIENDPILIPHQFTKGPDIEIAGFFAALLAWGQRKTIIAKCRELLERMDYAPHDFILSARDTDLRKLEGFRHRTFNDFDLLFIVDFLQNHYKVYNSLEDAFLRGNDPAQNLRTNLIAFRELFFTGSDPKIRTGKHISTPARKSACKRLNMYLRWMVRTDNRDVDFGLWKRISASQLVIPCDVHVENVARRLGLTTRLKANWDMAAEITAHLREIDPSDPVRFDFALFGMGIENYFHE